MFPHRCDTVRLVRCALVCVTLILGSGGGVAAQAAHAADVPAINVREIKDGELAASVERAIRGARGRLGHPECAGIFDDFSDGNGRPLTEVLATLAITACDLS